MAYIRDAHRCKSMRIGACANIRAYIYAHYPHHPTFPATAWPSLFETPSTGSDLRHLQNCCRSTFGIASNWDLTAQRTLCNLTSQKQPLKHAFVETCLKKVYFEVKLQETVSWTGGAGGR